jgi:hypothetical protein
MKIPVVPPPSSASTSSKAGDLRRNDASDVRSPGEAATLLAGLERQKEELGPIAEELINLLRHLGVGKPPLEVITPSSE